MAVQTSSRVWLFVVVVVAVIAALAALVRPELASYLWYRIAPDAPGTKSETIPCIGLSANVVVYLEESGIPHIEASTEEDLMFAIGFVHGRYRFFQMDLLRRYSQGRLSELLGEQTTRWGTTVDVDATMRGWGFDAACSREEQELDSDLAPLLDRYAAGVNAALARHVPLEYRLLRATPEAWQVRDTFAVGMVVAMGITHNWKQELYRLLLALRGGVRRSEQLYPSAPWPDSFSLEGTGEPAALPPAVAPELEAFLADFKGAPGKSRRVVATGLPDPGLHAGSNAWVIAGEATASGKPILANDPHLTHLVPSIFFQQHLRCPGMDVIGVTSPGIPFVLIGHTSGVAWGMTSTVADVTDLYVEKPLGTDGKTVSGPSGPETMEEMHFTVRVKEGTSFRESPFVMRKTGRGPLLNDLYPQALPEHAPWVSVRWELSGFSAGLQAYREANRATSVQELRQAFSGLALPPNNITAADVEGNVALFTAGRIPLRPNHLGTFPAPAWNIAYQWSEYIPYQQLPVHIGRTGIWANSNNLMLPPAQSGPLRQVDAAPAYRHARIVQRLEQETAATVEHSLKTQLDVAVLRAQRLVPVLLQDLAGMDTPTVTETAAMEMLASWDFDSPPESAGAAIFYSIYKEVGVAALRDEIEAGVLAFVLGFPYPTAPFDDWFDAADHPAWDDITTPEVETRPEVVRQGFRRAVMGLVRQMGDRPRGWRWGRLHDTWFKHPFGQRKVLDKLVNMPKREAGGGLETVNKAQFNMGDELHPFRTVSGAALRMVVDLGDIDNGRWVIETGQSGWPGADNYDNQNQLWSSGDTMEMLSDWERIPGLAAGIITLQPSGKSE